MHTYAQMPLAVGIVDDTAGLGGDIKALLGGVVLAIMYLSLVIMTGFATRSVLKTLVAAVGGGVVLGVVASQTVLSGKTSEELKKDHTVGARAAVVRVTDDPGAHVLFPHAGQPK